MNIGGAAPSHRWRSTLEFLGTASLAKPFTRRSRRNDAVLPFVSSAGMGSNHLVGCTDGMCDETATAEFARSRFLAHILSAMCLGS